MTMSAAIKDGYQSQFAQLESESSGHVSPWLRKLRRDALDRFLDLGFPTTDDEEWRFTNVSSIAKTVFDSAPTKPPTFDLRALLPAALSNDTIRLVFVNGRFDAALSDIEGLPIGVRAAGLSDVLRRSPSLVEPRLGRLAKLDSRPFTALNTALFSDGALIEIAPNKDCERPIVLVHIGAGNGRPLIANVRHMVILGPSSRASIVEYYSGVGARFSNTVVELSVENGAVADYYKLVCETDSSYHVGSMDIRQDRDSTADHAAVTLGGGLVRNDIAATLDGAGSHCTLNGLYLARGRQLVDNHTRLDHARPCCTSHELYKGILDDQARGVFTGRIHVHPDAQKTDAKQTNKALLLSEHAVVNAQPQLEIYADDVRCTHGATVGQLDEEALFYLRSRGLGVEHARGLLVHAFANDIIERIKLPALRGEMESKVANSRHWSGLTSGSATS